MAVECFWVPVYCIVKKKRERDGEGKRGRRKRRRGRGIKEERGEEVEEEVVK